MRKDGCDIWVGTQVADVHQARSPSSRACRQEAVKVHNHLIGGGFGRRLEVDFMVQRRQIAKHVKGR